MSVAERLRAETVDYHTAGEPFRIVLSGQPPIDGTTVAARRVTAIGDAAIGEFREFLCQEPRGHADMYGGFLVPPDDAGADLGVLFWHKDGFSTACGHGTIALGVWAVESGLVAAPSDGLVDVVIDVPSGRVTARVSIVNGRVTGAVFRNVASWSIVRGVELQTSRGPAIVDLSYSGAIYASVPASTFGLQVTPDHYTDLIAIGREIKWALNESEWARHDDHRLSGVYGTILFEDLGDLDGALHQRNVTVFADGEVDRSPCGSGTGARIALLAEEGRLAEGQRLMHDSIVGSRFEGWWERGADGALIPSVGGVARRTGHHEFVLEADDEVGTGFVLR